MKLFDHKMFDFLFKTREERLRSLLTGETSLKILWLKQDISKTIATKKSEVTQAFYDQKIDASQFDCSILVLEQLESEIQRF